MYSQNQQEAIQNQPRDRQISILPQQSAAAAHSKKVSAGRSAPSSLWSRLSLSAKATLIALGCGLLPIVGIGSIQLWQAQQTASVQSSTSSPSLSSDKNRPPQLQNLPEEAGSPQWWLTYFVMGGMTLLTISLLAPRLVNKTMQPILEASSILRKMGKGRFDHHLRIAGDDELAVLGTNINWLAAQLRDWQAQQEVESGRAYLLKELTLHLTHSSQLEAGLGTAVQAIRQVLKADRVMIYRLLEPSALVAESVDPEWRCVSDLTLQPTLENWFTPAEIGQLSQGQARTIEYISAAGTEHESQRAQLEAFAVQSSLTVPILVNQQLVGVLMIHQCSGSRIWETAEINFCAYFALQLGSGWERAMLLKTLETTQHSAAQEQAALNAQAQMLQRVADLRKQQLLAFSNTLEKAIQGDLAARVPRLDPETGIAADHYNALMAQLSQWVTDVQNTSDQFGQWLIEEVPSINQLTRTTAEQVRTIAGQSARTIAALEQAIQAHVEDTAKIAAVTDLCQTTADSEEHTLNELAQHLTLLQEQTPEMTRLLSGLQEPVHLIAQQMMQMHEAALQTNILAMNAAVDANRIEGESNYGFRIFASKIHALAEQFATTAQNIEQHLEQLRRMTQTLSGLTQGNHQMGIAGMHWLEAMGQNTSQLRQLHTELDQLSQRFPQVTAVQTQYTNELAGWMETLTQTAQRQAQTNDQLTQSLQQQLTVTQQLQQSVHTLNPSAPN